MMETLVGTFHPQVREWIYCPCIQKYYSLNEYESFARNSPCFIAVQAFGAMKQIIANIDR